MKHTLILTTIVATASLLAGCSGSSDDTASNGASQSTQSSAALPASLFATAAPDGATSLIDAKTSASTGDKVVFEARVGGRVDPFIEGRAMFFVADASLKSCDQLHGDTCPRPWDYCCEPKDNLVKHMATIRVVDESGSPIKASIQGQHGLEPLKTILVSGTVSDVNESGTFVVDADSIFIKEG